MNESGDIPNLTHNSSTPDNNSCSLISIIPSLGMSSCRGRAEAFARSLSSKLRTLGSQSEDEASQEDEPIINCETNAGALSTEMTVNANSNLNNNNNWIRRETQCESTVVTDLQPLRHETDSFFDFDCELESPGSPADECEYLRLIETASNTPHGESGCVCTSTASSNSSTDGPYYDVVTEDNSYKDETLKINGTITANNAVIKLESATEIEIQPITDIKLTEDEESETTITTDKEEINMLVDELPQQQKQIEEIEACIESMEIIKITEQVSESMQNGHVENVTIISTEPNNTTKELECTTGITQNITTLTTTTSSSVTNVKRNNSFTHSGLDTTDDEDECRPQRVRRCSSLKTGKTPPGTPGRKKIVRFADKLGLDLADIKTFLDEIPNIPKSAYEDLEIHATEPPIQFGPKSDKLLVPLFQQPGGLPTFLDLVRERQVSLENAAVTDHINQTITGSVRVRNLDFHKSVHIRYTLDHWRSFADLQGNYVENSCDGFSDKFSFVLFGNSLQVGQRLEFAVRFQCKGQQFWDNNYGINYCFQCLPTNNGLTTATTVSIATMAVIQQSNTNNSHNNNNNNNNNNTNNNNNNNSNINNNSYYLNNLPSKPLNGLDQADNQNHALRLISPTVGDSWCSSFY